MAKEESKVVKYLDNKVEIKAKPPVGENVPIYIRPGDKIDLQALGINLETANFKLIGGDIVLDVPGGGSFTFVSLALMGYSDSQPEFLGMGGKLVSLGTILSNIEEVNAIPVSSVVTNEFVNMPPATPEEIKKEKISQVILSDNNPSTEEKSNIDESIAESSVQQQNSGVAEVNENIAMQTESKSQTKTEDSNKTKTEDSNKTKTEDSKVEGIAPTLTFDIDIQHVEIKENTTYDADGKTLTVYGGGGVSYANIYPKGYNSVDKNSLMAQTDAEMIYYSDKKFGSYDRVVIYADDSALFNETTTSRTIVLNPNQPEGFAITQITISSNSLPSGFKILNGVQSGNSWIIQKDNPLTDAIEGFTIDSTGAVNITFSVDNTQESNFVFTLSTTSTFSMDNVSEANKSTIETPVKTVITAEKEYAVQVKEIENGTQPVEYNFESFSLNGKEYTSGFVISTNINDTETVGAQELINTIFGGIVNDTITGGLQSDTIYGNTGNDTIVTRAGNDIVDGEEGIDTLDYSEIDNISNVGIDANLNTGIVTFKIDTISTIDSNTTFTNTIANIENIIATQDKDIIVGNAQNNTLKGMAGADTISGGAGEDSIEGGDGNDTISGNAGNDILKAGAGNDTVSYKTAVNTVGTSSGVVVNLSDDPDDATKGKTTGIDGDDYLWDFENVIGSDYDDTIIGNTLKNTIWAEDGNDTLNGGLGNDYLDGGNGSDTVDYSASNASEFIYLESSIVSGVMVGEASGGDGEDSLYDIENVIGSIYADTIYGSSLSNTLDAGKGNDTIYAAAGNDSINGGSGDDILYGEVGNDTILAGLGDDTLSGGSGDDILNGGSGNDYVNYSELSNLAGDLKGVEVDLTITTQQDTKKDGLDTLSEIENVIGSSYNDTIIGTTGDNIILAGAGNDTIVSNGSSALGSDTIFGDAGNDNIYTGAGTGDVALGEGGTDTLYGNFDSDFLIGGVVSSTLIDDPDLDWVNLTSTIAGVILDLSTTVTAGTGVYAGSYSQALVVDATPLDNTDNTQFDYIRQIEHIIGSTGDDTFTGNTSQNSILAGDGDDIIYYTRGLDYYDGGNHTTIAGTQGSTAPAVGGGDWISLEKETTTTVDFRLDNSNIGANITNGLATISNIENVIGYNGAQATTGYGNSGNNIFVMYGGADIILGGDGSDVYDLGAGNDRAYATESLVASGGSDTLIGGAGIDILDYRNNWGSTVGNIIILTTQNMNGTVYDVATYTSLITVSGLEIADGEYTFFKVRDGRSGLWDYILQEKTTDIATGAVAGTADFENFLLSAYADIFSGDSDANTVSGNEGNDTIYGQSGNDTIYGGNNSDYIHGGADNDRIYGESDGDTLYGNEGNDSIDGGDLNDSVYGGIGNDTLLGGNADDKLYGEDGDDTLYSDNGIDNIDGGIGTDLLLFGGTGTARVVVNLSAGAITYDTTNQLAANSILDNGGNTDTVVNLTIENVTGGIGADTFAGSTANNVLNGAGGNDYFYASLGTDNIIGNTGSDTLDFTNLSTTAGVNVTLNSSLAFSSGSTAYTQTVATMENFTGSSQNDTITGDGVANVLNGGAGDDTIDGKAGIDVINGGAGNDLFTIDFSAIDTIDGGADSDTVKSTSTYSLSADTNFASAGNFTNIETLDISGMTLSSTNDTEYTFNDSTVGSWLGASTTLTLKLKSTQAEFIKFTGNKTGDSPDVGNVSWDNDTVNTISEGSYNLGTKTLTIDFTDVP